MNGLQPLRGGAIYLRTTARWSADNTVKLPDAVDIMVPVRPHEAVNVEFLTLREAERARIQREAKALRAST
jgi:hypothetical protein